MRRVALNEIFMSTAYLIFETMKGSVAGITLLSKTNEILDVHYYLQNSLFV
jgi:hypothetical protein